MVHNNINPPLSNMQMELLKLYSTGIDDEHLNDLRKVIAKFLLEKARKKADKIWDEKCYSQETIEKMLNDGKG